MKYDEITVGAERTFKKAQLPDRVVCQACGCLDEDLTSQLRRADDLIEALKDDNAAKVQLIKYLRKVADRDPRNSPHYEPAMRVLTYWQEQCCPNARELEGDRLTKVLARMNGRPRGYSEQDLRTCVFGYAQYPYMVDGHRRRTGPRERRFVDAELIFRTPKHVEAGIELARASGESPVELVQPAPNPPRDWSRTDAGQMLCLFEAG